MLITAQGSPFIRPKPAVEPPATPTPKTDPKKLDEAAAIMVATKHCLSLDGSLNQQQRLIDAYNHQPDLDNLSPNMSDEQREKVVLYTMGRPDIPDFGFLIPNIWRVTGRNARIKFNAVFALELSQILNIPYNSQASDANCKPVMQGEITAKGIFQHAIISMPLAFNNSQIGLTYLMTKQNSYNWQMDDLLIDNAGVANFVRKDLANAVTFKTVGEVTREICINSKIAGLDCK